MLNIDELTDRLKSIERNDENAHLSLTMNLKELQQNQQYADSNLEVANENDEVLLIIEFDDVDSSTSTLTEEATSIFTTSFIFSLSTESTSSSRRQFVIDISKSIDHERIRTSTLNIFDVALKL